MRGWAVVTNGEPLQEIELPTPEPTGTEIVLEVTHCGVCHSDLHIWEGFYDLGGRGRLMMRDRGMPLPLAMGHEIVGRVTELGADAAAMADAPPIGARRIVYPWVGCGVCDRCRAEEDNMCLTPRSIGIFQHGGYATHVKVPHPRHLVDPGTLDPALAATYACSGITVFAAIGKVMPLPPAEPVVVVGAGGLGLSAIAVLRALGHARIVVVDVDDAKREAAMAAGASDTVDASASGVTERIVEICGGPVAAVIDLVNGTATARFAFDALRKGGKLVQVGLFGGELALPLPLMAMRALTVQGSFVGSPKDLRALVALAQAGKLPALPVTTLPRQEANAALMRLRDGRVTGRLVLQAEAA